MAEGRDVPVLPCSHMSLHLIDRLKELLRAKLTECGWKDQMKAHCKGKPSVLLLKHKVYVLPEISQFFKLI